MRFLPLIFLVCIACQSTSRELKFIENYIYYNKSDEVISKKRKITKYNEGSWQSTILDSKGSEIDSWQSFHNGNISSLYQKGELQSIKTKDPATGCVTDRDFSKRGFGEFTSCNGEEVHNVFFSKNSVLEKKCINTLNKQVCRATENGNLVFNEYRLISGNTVIDYSEIFGDEKRYHMYISFDLPNGIRTENYEMTLPPFEAVPKPEDSRWKWSYTETKAGYIESIGLYSSTKYVDRDSRSEAMLETF